jgi:hypothetical protein
MYIYLTCDETKNSINKGAEYHAQLDSKGRLNQNEFSILTNKLIEGIPCFIKGVQIKAPYDPMHVFRYISVTIKDKSQIPEKVTELAKTKSITLMQAIIEHNEDTKQRVGDYIKRRTAYLQNLDVRNEYYKAIMEVAMKLNIKAYSPCAKTYPECKATQMFMGFIPNDEDITDEQIAYVECNARKYGLEIPTVDYHISSRQVFGTDKYGNQVSHGYTEEIQIAHYTRPTYNESRFGETFKRSKEQYMYSLHPNNLPEEHTVQSMGTTKGQYKEVLKQLQYIESLDPETRDFFIADGYTRCPCCGEITRKVNNFNVDIRCEYCDAVLEELVITTNNHLLYGTDIDEEYSDLDDIKYYIDNHEDEEEQEVYDE